MMPSAKVYFADLHATRTEDNLINKLELLCEKLQFNKIIEAGDFVAVKMHFGEPGSSAFIRPVFVAPIVNAILKAGGKPFLTDTTTLYRGERSDAVKHLWTAYKHGFIPPVINAPVIISDGLLGTDTVEVNINNGKYFKTVKIASSIYYAEVLIGLAHPTGHIGTGFGGAIKNIGMGSSSKAGKQLMHSDIKPSVKPERCIGCKRCIQHCPANAIGFENGKAKINHKLCIGCAECTVICQQGAVKVNWDTPALRLQEKIVEYTSGVLHTKNNKVVFFNFIMNVSPQCDCPSWTDYPLVKDIGILASHDIVAVDQATLDLINREAGTDVFKACHGIDSEIQLRYAEKLKIGTRKYELIKI